MESVSIKGREHLIRDIKSKAILSTDTAALARYNSQKEQINKQKRTEEDVAQLKQDVSEIKSLLIAILNRE